MPFRCVPMPTATAERFRQTDIDDNGNTLRRIVSDGGGAPCRHCLRNAGAGEVMLLGSYSLPAPLGIYWTPSPIFLHVNVCPHYKRENDIPEIVRTRLVSVRSYDANNGCIYDLGEVVEGTAIDLVVNRALADLRTKFINVHTARPGCLLCRIERT